jgi:flagellar hook protein FlgE
MIRSLNSGVSGLQNFQQRMDVIGNNVANVNTTGYKSARTDFADTFSQTLTSAGGNGQVGTGVSTAAVKTMTGQGALARTGHETDLAIVGNGYFAVRDATSDAQFATRAGDFRLNDAGYLVTNTGHRVQGFTNGGLAAIGDIQIDANGKPASSPDATMQSFRIDGEGKIMVHLSDGTQFVRGQILLHHFSDPQALIKVGHNLYSGLAGAGPAGGGGTPLPVPPGTNGAGKIQSNALEMSNVDLAGEFSTLITTQRAFQASARIISTSDDLLQETVNLKR